MAKPSAIFYLFLGVVVSAFIAQAQAGVFDELNKMFPDNNPVLVDDLRVQSFCEAGHAPACAYLRQQRQLGKEMAGAERACSRGNKARCEWLNALKQSAYKARTAVLQSEVRPAEARIERNDGGGGWDPLGDVTHPERIGRNVQREGEKAWSEAKKAFTRYIPTNPTCLNYTGNLTYVETMVIIDNNREELAHNGVTDRESCRSKRDVIVAVAARYNVILAAGVWNIGRCACDAAY